MKSVFSSIAYLVMILLIDPNTKNVNHLVPDVH